MGALDFCAFPTPCLQSDRLLPFSRQRQKAIASRRQDTSCGGKVKKACNSLLKFLAIVPGTPKRRWTNSTTDRAPKRRRALDCVVDEKWGFPMPPTGVEP